jgi:ATP-binding protein involved in chromosome partitioning
VAQKVAVRLADMARRSFMPIVGVVENMSDFTCEHGTSYALFGSGGGAELAEELAVPLIGQIPIDPAIVRAGDEGVPPPDHEAAGTVFREVAARVMELVPPVEDESCTGRIAKLLEALDTRQLAVGS